MKEPRDLLHRPAGLLEIARVAAPLAVGTLSLALMQFFDRLFLAGHSDAAIRAALPAGILAFTMMSGLIGLVAYGGTLVAHAHGAGDRRLCARAAGQAVLLALALWPLLWLTRPLGHAILRRSGHGADVLPLELAYFDVLIAGGLGPLLTHAFAGFFSGRGDTRTTMWAHLSSNLLNIGLDWVLIFGRFGLPAMGIHGAAIATVISGFVSAGVLAARFFSPAHLRDYHTHRALRPDLRLLGRLLRFGVPAGLHMWLDLTSFTFFVLLTGRFGAAEHAASNIALAINSLAFMPTLAIGQAATIVVGQYQGRGRPDLARRAGWNALAMAAGYMGAVGLSYVLAPEMYIAVFTDRGRGAVPHAAVAPIARRLLTMLAVWSTGDAADLAIAGALKGAGDTRFVMTFSLLMAYGVFVGGLLVIVGVFGGGLMAAWLWCCVYILVMGVGYIARFLGGRWSSIRVLPHDGATPDGVAPC
ncbi:MAG: MATE family efflux transporter [Kiritimatiellae bacterium]|nr:MATE family efflux transporter [Kiritimatiellia bacterium]